MLLTSCEDHLYSFEEFAVVFTVDEYVVDEFKYARDVCEGSVGSGTELIP